MLRTKFATGFRFGQSAYFCLKSAVSCLPASSAERPCRFNSSARVLPDVSRGQRGIGFDEDHLVPLCVPRAKPHQARSHAAKVKFRFTVEENRSEERRVGKECRSRW